MTCDKRGLKVALLAITLAFAMSSSAYAACGEASCVPAQGTYISHFTGPNCDGTESYYLPYNNWGYQCRPGNGTGDCGTIRRTVTNRSYYYQGQCHPNAWPNGNTLNDFVTVYRNTAPPPKYPPVACGWASPSSGMAPLWVSFYGSCSYDPDGGPVSLSWYLGDGFGWGSYWSHTYWNPGSYPVWLDVVDDEGQWSSTFIGYVWVY